LLESLWSVEAKAVSLPGKLGPLTKENVNSHAAALSVDALKDFAKDSEEVWAALDSTTLERIQRTAKSIAGSYCSDIIRG